jgi:hypothetical protein
MPWTRLHLFRHLPLYKRNFSELLLLLQSPHCTFPTYVRSLDIDWQLEELPISSHKTLLDVLYSQHHWLNYRNKGDSIGLLRSSFHKVRASVAYSIDRSVAVHAMNVFRLFPTLEHLQVQLLGCQSKVGGCNGLPPIPSTLKSLTLICNSSPPTGSPVLPGEWINFLRWMEQERICNISALYLARMSIWDSVGVEALLKLQGSSLRHIHVRPSSCEFCLS